MKSNPLFSSVVLRPAVSRDRAAIASIARNAFAKYTGRIGREPESMVADYEEIIDRGGVMAAVIGTFVAGYVEMYPRNDHLLIGEIAVSPSFLEQGIAHAMYVLIVVVARAHGVSCLRPYTNAAMHENIAFYEEAADFTITECREENGFERVYMSRDLIAGSQQSPLQVPGFPYSPPTLSVFATLPLDEEAIGTDHHLPIDWLDGEGKVQARREETLHLPDDIVASGPFAVSFAVNFEGLRFSIPVPARLDSNSMQWRWRRCL